MGSVHGQGQPRGNHPIDAGTKRQIDDQEKLVKVTVIDPKQF
jgi:hypothetical protein